MLQNYIYIKSHFRSRNILVIRRKIILYSDLVWLLFFISTVLGRCIYFVEIKI